MSRSLTFRHTDQIAVLQGLLPAYRAAVEKFENLAKKVSSPGWRDLFVRFWQDQCQCLIELEDKIRELGADPEAVTPTDEFEVSLHQWTNILSRDKEMLLQSLNHQTHLVHLYTQLRLSPLSYDVRTLLQRHHLHARQTLERLTSIYLIYPPRAKIPVPQMTI